METKNPNIIEIRNFFKVKNKTSESFFIQSFFLSNSNHTHLI